MKEVFNRPKLVMSSRQDSDKDSDVEFAINNRFDGVDWSFALNRMPFNTASRTRLISQIRKLEGHLVEVRFHAPFRHAEIGCRDLRISQWAMELYIKTLELIAEVGGRFLTLHIGLGDISDKDICLQKVLENLNVLKAFGLNRGVTITLENLLYGPTSIPEQWMEILGEVDIPATFDLGHARGCEAVVKGLWTPIEIIYQVKSRLIHVHIYKEENGGGHVPPETIEDLGVELLDALIESPCRWWVIELKEKSAALRTKEMLKTYMESIFSKV